MPRDPLAALARLRGVELDAARRARAAAAADRARIADRQAAQAASREAGRHGDPAHYAAWRPAAEAERMHLANAASRAEAVDEAARLALAEARAAARAVEQLREQRRARARHRRLTREQAMLDDLPRR